MEILERFNSFMERRFDEVSNFISKDRRTKMEKEIDDFIDEMSELPKDSEEYKRRVEVLEQLMKAKSYDGAGSRVSADAKFTEVMRLIEIVGILNFEKVGIITSKVFSILGIGRRG